MRRLSALLISTVLLSGCASLQRLAAGAFASPRLQFEKATMTALDLDGATVVLDFTLENPNDVAFRVASATWRLDAEGARVSEGQLPGGVTLPSRGKAPFAVTVRLRWADVARLTEQLQGKSEVAYRVAGVIRVDTPLGVVELPYQHEGHLPVPRLPVVRLAGASVDVISFTELELELTLDVENSNHFMLPGATIHFDVLLNDALVATGHEATLKPLGAGGQARLTLPIRVSLLGAGRALSTMHGGGELRLRGAIRAGGMEKPLDLRMDVGKK
jgi:LEA14-like dessication related protein